MAMQGLKRFLRIAKVTAERVLRKLSRSATSIEYPRKFIAAAWIALSRLGCYPWFAKKNLQSIRRTHFSLLLAASLAVAVVVREWRELSKIFSEMQWLSPFGWLVVLIIVATWLAFGWEFWGDKLSTSPQELRFHYGTKLLLRRLEDLSARQPANTNIEQKFDDFVKYLLEVAADTFSVKHKVDSGLMVKLPDENSLQLVKWSSGANYPPGLKIPLPVNDDFTDTGPAGVAFVSLKLVYVPKKRRKRAWQFEGLEDDEEPRYVPLDSYKCWISAPDPSQENFWSVLCVPVAFGADTSQRKRFGVLNFSTNARDPFVPRDFFMAEFYARILCQAFGVIDRKRKRSGTTR